eukprot:2018594-Amphidinium_carterae.1
MDAWGVFPSYLCSLFWENVRGSHPRSCNNSFIRWTIIAIIRTNQYFIALRSKARKVTEFSSLAALSCFLIAHILDS